MPLFQGKTWECAPKSLVKKIRRRNIMAPFFFRPGSGPHHAEEPRHAATNFFAPADGQQAAPPPER
jgi:hypothetical protein